VKTKSKCFKIHLNYELFFAKNIFQYSIYDKTNESLLMQFFQSNNKYKLIYISSNINYKQYLSQSIFRKAIRMLKHTLISLNAFYNGI
jgi:hypothetical protein